MNSRIFLVAAREFRQIAGTRSFWLTLLILPIALAIGPVAQRLMGKDDVDRVMIVDRTGGVEAEAITRRLSVDHDRDILSALSRFVQRRKLERADPGALWASHDRWYSDADVETFERSGGLPAALAKLRAVSAEDTARFDPPKPDFTIVPPPAAVAAASDAAIDKVVQPLLHPADKDAKPVDYVVLIPADFGASPAVRLWSNEAPSPQFAAALQSVLTRDLRQRYLTANGLSPSAAAAAGTIAPALTISRPAPGGGTREQLVVRSILPLVAAYMLVMSLMLSGSWMLQSMVEERSNKLLETVLACVSPEELMYGKLLGVLAVGLSMLAVWIGCGFAAGYVMQGAIADYIRPALAPLTSPGIIAALIYFFVVGYLAIAILFLGIGVTSDSMRDAQGYLTPLIFAILLPTIIMMQALLSGASGIGIEILTWVPIWTPFVVLARLGFGIPTWEVIGAGAVLALFVALELALLGRLFRASLLASGQKGGLAALLKRRRKPVMTA